MTLHKFTEFYIEWFNVCLNIASKFRTVAMFISFVKQNNDSNKTCSYANDILPYQSSFVLLLLQHFMSCLQKRKYKF
jgi:hypothetical protein